MNGKDFIKQAEGLKLKAYLDTAGIPTIGYGHTKGVKIGQTITKDKADQFFEDDYNDAVKQLSSVVKVKLTQGQQDALVSFVFNLGIGRLKTSTLLRKLNNGDTRGAAIEFGKWVYSGGKVTEGLVARRARERELFESKE